MRARSLFPLGLFLLGFSPPLAAEGQVWIVDAAGGGDFTTIAAAISAVGDGDIVLVRQGTYVESPSVVGKSLTIQADDGATVIAGVAGMSSPASIRNLTASQSVRLQGLTLALGLNLVNNQGSVWIEDCSITSGHPGILAQDSTAVVLIRTTARGDELTQCTDGDFEAGSGLVLERASVHAFGCTFTGGDGFMITKFFPPSDCFAQYAGDGIRSLDAQDFLFLSDCTARGGEGICTLHEFGVRIGESGQGLRAIGTAEVLDSKLEGGPPGHQSWVFPPAPVCTPAGLPSSGPVRTHPGRSLRFTWADQASEQSPVELTFEGPPHAAVLLSSGPKVETLFSLTPLGSALIGLPRQLDFAGFLDATGRLSITVQLPPLHPLVEGRPVFAQAYYLDPHPAGPLGGSGKIRHVPLRFVRGEGSMLVGLDESF